MAFLVEDNVVVSIYNSMNTPMPMDTGPLTTPTLHASSKVTKTAEVPTTFKPIDPQYYENVSAKTMKHLPKKAKKALKSENVPSPITNWKMNNEQSVLSAMHRHALDPIIRVLIHCFGQHTFIVEPERIETSTWEECENLTKPLPRKRKAGESRLEAEDEQFQIRVDLSFKDSITGKTIANVEAKRFGAIRRKDFEKAIARNQVANVVHGKTRSKMKGNAVPITKQCITYTDATGCPRSGAYEYGRVVLFNFKGRGGASEITIVDERDQHQSLLRSTLLGWLICAFKEAGFQPRQKR